MISLGSCIYPTLKLDSVKVLPSRVASPENYKHQTLKVSGPSGVTPTYLMGGARNRHGLACTVYMYNRSIQEISSLLSEKFKRMRTNPNSNTYTYVRMCRYFSDN